jgi:hypothetical protein
VTWNVVTRSAPLPPSTKLPAGDVSSVSENASYHVYPLPFFSLCVRVKLDQSPKKLKTKFTPAFWASEREFSALAHLMTVPGTIPKRTGE